MRYSRSTLKLSGNAESKSSNNGSIQLFPALSIPPFCPPDCLLLLAVIRLEFITIALSLSSGNQNIFMSGDLSEQAFILIIGDMETAWKRGAHNGNIRDLSYIGGQLLGGRSI